MHIQWENKHLTEEKNTLVILVTFLVVILMRDTVVSAAYEKQELQGGYNQGEHHFHNWQDHRPHHHHDY